jgi:protein SCO1/2
VHTPGVARDIRVAFITVDPKRDSAQTLKRYVGLFDPTFIGLTGDLRSLNPVYAAYHTLRRAVPGGGNRTGGNRTQDSFEHGTTIYYIGRNGSIDGLGQWDDAPVDIARYFRSLD